jgi:hypothetical protein
MRRKGEKKKIKGEKRKWNKIGLCKLKFCRIEKEDR